MFVQPFVLKPDAVRASDGTFDDRIQVTWIDTGVNEQVFNVFRVDDGDTLLVGTVQADQDVYDDLSAVPGGAFEYCVSASNQEIALVSPQLGASDLVCDIGWRRANGAISGQVSALVQQSAQLASSASDNQVETGQADAQMFELSEISSAATEPLLSSSAVAGGNAVDVCLDPNPNQALRLDGIEGHVSVGHVQRPAQMTVCGWINTKATGQNMLMSWGNNEDSSGLVFWQVFDGTLFYGQVAPGNFRQLGSTVPVNTGQWVHVCVVRDGDRADIYVDGEQRGSATGFDFPILTNTLTIGASRDSNGSSGFLDGAIDEVQIWSVALDSTGIAARMSTKLTGQEENLIGYWPFDQGQGRVAPDLSPSAAHGTLQQGVHWLQGPPVGECTRSDNNGNYTVRDIRYGEGGTFTVTPIADRRSFVPAQKEITLSIESPIENQVDFADVTQVGITGRIEYEGTECPVPDVEIRVNGVNRTNTESDGTYSVSVFPSDDPTDLYRIEPKLTSRDASDVTQFQPQKRDLFADADLFDVNFVSTKKRVLRGFFGGSCAAAGNIGTATLKVFTEDGCFELEVPISAGDFELELAPQKYLVQVTNVVPANAELQADIIEFFDELGAREVDLTVADDTLDFIYRPDIKVEIAGFSAPPAECTSTGFTADGRTFDAVPIVGRLQKVPLTINVSEDYGALGACPVEEGTVQIFDAVADLSGSPTTLAIKDGKVEYETFGASPNITAGAFVDGADRSFQKSLTAIANVEGKAAVSATEWAVVEGLRPRTAEFVSATTDPFPLMILRDPPGSNSFAYIEEGTQMCTTISDMTVTGGSAGFAGQGYFGFKQFTGIALGPFVGIDGGAGLLIRAKIKAGRDNGSGGALEICTKTTERWSTSSDMTWVGENLYMGVALNLVFARADVLDIEDCQIDLSEQIVGDVDPQDAFETTYVYGGTHIEQSLIPALEDLIDLTSGDVTLSGDPNDDGTDDVVRLDQALDNWNKHLTIEDSLAQSALVGNVKNRSFSSGAEYEYSHEFARDTTSTRSTRIYFDTEDEIGLILTLAWDNEALATFSVNHETTRDSTASEGTSRAVGYVFSDGDTGDFFSVDVGDDPRYHTPVFGIVSGRSSNPWEHSPGSVESDGRTCGTDRKRNIDGLDNPCTQRRDWPEIEVATSGGVLRNVDPDGQGTFEVTLTNKSETPERRQYVLGVPGETNPRNLGLTATGDLLGGERLETFLLGANESRTINVDVLRVSPPYAYEDVALIFYPATEYEIWKSDPRQTTVMVDTAFISVYFDAPCSDISLVRPKNPWLVNTTSEDSLEIVLGGFTGDVSLANALTAIGLEYRKVGTPDWLPAANASIAVNLADPLESDSLDPAVTSWTTRWLPPFDGDYELRAFTSCEAVADGDDPPPTVFSEVITGQVDRNAPRILGTPTPSDQVLALGSSIAATFNEPIDCESISTAGGFQNTKLRFVTGPSATPPDSAGVGGIDAVCNGETVVIEPPDTFDWDAAEGQIMEARFVSGLEDAQGKSQVIEDLAGNPIANDIAWQFTVRRSAFTWSPADLTVDVDLGSAAGFEANLVNGRVRLVEYALNGVPGWLSASPPEGTVAPADASSVSFLVSDTLAIGQYTASVLAENDGLPARLNLTVDVSCPSPGWDLNPSRFSYSMNLTAALSLEGIPSTDTDDRLGAFVGDELRGTGTANTSGIVQMTIYSPLPAGETVTFRALDASACRLYPATDLILPFVTARKGNPSSPNGNDAMNNAPQPVSVGLAKGWTWSRSTKRRRRQIRMPCWPHSHHRTATCSRARNGVQPLRRSHAQLDRRTERCYTGQRLHW